jgi:hypothetical protein
MSSVILNKKTKRYNTLKTAIKNGLYENPNNFDLGFYYIDPIKNKFVSEKIAKSYLKDGKTILFDKQNQKYNYINNKFEEPTKTYNTFQKTADILPSELKPFYKKDYSLSLDSPLDIISNPIKNIDKILNTFINSYKYLSINEGLQDYKIQLVLYGKNNYFSVAYNSDFNEALKNIKSKLESLINEYADFTFIVDELIISFLKPDMSYIGSSDIKINKNLEILGNKEFRIINTFSYSNCLYHAFILCENTSKLSYFMNNTESLINTSKQLKKRLNPTNKMLSTFETIQELADYKKRVINIYDSVLKLTKTFKPSKDNKKSPINIQIVNNHAKALIPWSEIDESIKFDNDDEEIKIKSNERNKSTIINKKFNSNNLYDDKIAVWDIECSPDENGNFKSYALGVAYEDKYISFWGLDCIKQFIDFLNKNFSFFNNWTFYAHNGGKFDFLLLLREGLLDFKNIIIDSKNLVELNKSFIGVSLLKDDLKINFKDSLRLLPQSLDSLCREFNVKYKKLKETIKHSDITLQNFNSREIYPHLYLYLRNDCLGLLEILKSFSLNVFNDTKINITSCYTGASLSKKNYFLNYYDSKKTPIYTLSDDIDEFIRKGYNGGRNEAFHIGKIEGKIYYLDFTSLYPYTGTFKLPYGLPKQSNLEDYKTLTLEDLKNRFGFYNVLVKTIDKTKKPIHGIKSKNGLFVFPIFENWTQLNGLFTEEIKIGLKNNIYEYQFLEGYEFENSTFLKKFFIDAFNKKSEAKINGNKALSLCYKIVANSGYGYWGLRCKSRDGIKIFHQDQSGIIPILISNKLMSYCDYGNYTFVRCYNDLKIKDYNVSIASAISSYARIRLWNAINDIEIKGGNVFYCDTDSIMTNLDISKYPDLMEKYMWDGKGDALGCLKNECADDILSELKNKYSKEESKNIFDNQLKIDNNFNSFDELIIGGCKFYSIKKTLYNGDVIEINKLKGYKNDNDDLNFDLFDMLNNNSINEISQNQIQFVAPKSFYTSINDKFRITTKKILKKFKINYTKGYVDNSGNIKPLIF